MGSSRLAFLVAAVGLVGLVVVVAVAAAAPVRPQRMLENGAVVQGVVRTTAGGVNANASADSFLGIRFAQAPVGNLRFAQPQPYTYPGTLPASSRGRIAFLIRRGPG